jgi:hypothetical protein
VPLNAQDLSCQDACARHSMRCERVRGGFLSEVTLDVDTMRIRIGCRHDPALTRQLPDTPLALKRAEVGDAHIRCVCNDSVNVGSIDQLQRIQDPVIRRPLATGNSAAPTERVSRAQYESLRRDRAHWSENVAMRGPLPDEERESTETTTHRTYVELLRSRLTWLEDLRTVSDGAATSATATVRD